MKRRPMDRGPHDIKECGGATSEPRWSTTKSDGMWKMPTTAFEIHPAIGIARLGFPGVLEKFLAVDFNYPYMKALQTHKRHGLWA
jgi:hypothetical protein